MTTFRMFVACVCIAFLSTTQTVQAAIPNDPFAEQWGYELTDVYDAWDLTTGSKQVIVAVIDNGFDQYHTDLAGNVWTNKDEIPRNNIDDDNNGYVDDVYGWNFVESDTNGDGLLSALEKAGNNDLRPDTKNLNTQTKKIVNHGTFVAGLIGAKGNNGLHGAGLNWDVSLMNVKIVGSGGSGSLGQLDAAIRYAVDNGASIISMSIIGGVEGTDVSSIVSAINYAYEHDVVLVGAAGNSLVNLNASPLYPICADSQSTSTKIIGSSAISENKALAVFSNFGSNCIDITAPGVNINSIGKYAPSVGLNSAYLRGYQGTSFAVPFISGTAALIRSVRPDLSAASVIESILNSTTKTPPKDEVAYANLYGKGLINVAGAITYAMDLPFNSDNAEIHVHAGQAYQFSAGSLIGVEPQKNIRTFSKKSQVVSVAGTTVSVIDAKKTNYTFETASVIGEVTKVDLDTSQRATLVVLYGTQGVAWYTVDGIQVNTQLFEAYDTVYQVSELDDQVAILAQKGSELVLDVFDRKGTRSAHTNVALPLHTTSAAFDSTGAVYAAVNIEGVNTVYTFDTEGTDVQLFTSPGATVIQLEVLEDSPTHFLFFSQFTGSIWSLEGEVKETFNL